MSRLSLRLVRSPHRTMARLAVPWCAMVAFAVAVAGPWTAGVRAQDPKAGVFLAKKPAATNPPGKAVYLWKKAPAQDPEAAPPPDPKPQGKKGLWLFRAQSPLTKPPQPAGLESIFRRPGNGTQPAGILSKAAPQPAPGRLRWPSGGPISRPGTAGAFPGRRPPSPFVPASPGNSPVRPALPGGLPDLVVSKFETTGHRTDLGGGVWSIPILLEVTNRSRTASAGRFNVAVSYNTRQHTPGALIDFRVPGGRPDSWTPWTRSSLGPGERVSFTGTIRVDEKLAPSNLLSPATLWAEADTARGEEFAQTWGHVRESDEKNNTATLSVSWPIRRATPPAGVAGPTRPAPPRPSQPETWSIRVNTLDIVRRNESSGDEPYLVVVGYRATLGNPDSVRTVVLAPRAVLGDDVKETGDHPIQIHESFGVVRFPNVRRLTTQEIAGGAQPEIIGMAVVAMESDRVLTDDAVTAATRRAIENTVKDTVKRAVTGDFQQIPPGGGDFWTQAGEFLISFGGNDDLVGYDSKAYIAVAQDGDLFLNNRALTMDFDAPDEDGHYRAHGAVGPDSRWRYWVRELP